MWACGECRISPRKKTITACINDLCAMTSSVSCTEPTLSPDPKLSLCESRWFTCDIVVLRKGTSHSISCLQNLHRTIALICARYLFLSSRQENAEMQKLKQVCISMGLHGKRCVCRIQRFVVVARSLSKWHKVTTNTRIRKTNETRQARRQRHLARSREPRGRRPEEHEMKAIRNDIQNTKTLYECTARDGR